MTGLDYTSVWIVYEKAIKLSGVSFTAQPVCVKGNCKCVEFEPGTNAATNVQGPYHLAARAPIGCEY